MQVSLERSVQAKVIFVTLQQTSHFGEKIKGLDNDDVRLTLVAVICDMQYKS